MSIILKGIVRSWQTKKGDYEIVTQDTKNGALELVEIKNITHLSSLSLRAAVASSLHMKVENVLLSPRLANKFSGEK